MVNKKSNGRRRAKGRLRRRKQVVSTGARVLTAPPSIEMGIAFTRKFRYVQLDATTHPITFTSISLTNLLCVAIDATHLVPIIQAVRLKKLEFWVPSSSIGFQWSNAYGNAKTYTDTSLSTTIPAHLSLVPPIKTNAENWSTYVDGVTFGAVGGCTQGSVVDVTLDICLCGSQNDAVPSTLAAAGATIGGLYYICIDGINGYWKPIGYMRSA